MSRRMMARECAHCHEPFHALVDQVNRGNGRFCSRTCGVKHRTRPLADRFWEKVARTNDPLSCWEWTAGRGAGGYGQLNTRPRRMELAHRISWMLHFGPIPEGIQVLHQCDNRICVRPEHLFLGTLKDNQDDKMAKGRQAKGERIAKSRLTEAQVREIRRRHAEGGVTQQHLAKEFGVANSTISVIISRQNWSHVE